MDEVYVNRKIPKVVNSLFIGELISGLKVQTLCESRGFVQSVVGNDLIQLYQKRSFSQQI